MNGFPDPVWQRFAEPAHAGALAPSASVRTGRASTPGGDAELELDVALGRERIDAAAFRVYGCPMTIAAADWLCERVAGAGIAEVRQLGVAELETALALPAHKRFCGLLALDALTAALRAEVATTTGKMDCDDGNDGNYGH